MYYFAFESFFSLKVRFMGPLEVTCCNYNIIKIIDQNLINQNSVSFVDTVIAVVVIFVADRFRWSLMSCCDSKIIQILIEDNTFNLGWVLKLFFNRKFCNIIWIIIENLFFSKKQTFQILINICAFQIWRCSFWKAMIGKFYSRLITSIYPQALVLARVIRALTVTFTCFLSKWPLTPKYFRLLFEKT